MSHRLTVSSISNFSRYIVTINFRNLINLESYLKNFVMEMETLNPEFTSGYYKCDWCLRVYERKNSLDNHLLKKHSFINDKM